MNSIVRLLSAAVLVVSSANPVLAADSMHGTMMMPKCSAGDPMVSVNTKTKTYVMPDKSQMTMSASHNGSEMSGSQMSGAHSGNAMSSNGMMKSGMTMMCKSKADAMGAHMMKSKSQM